MLFVVRAVLISFLAASAGYAGAEEVVRVAAAANFKPALEELTELYSKSKSVRFVVTTGASGVLYAQIRSGAPFDLFFSADDVRTAQLDRDGLAVPNTRAVYAIGKLVLWTPGRPIAADLEQTLRSKHIRTVALANPATAPYGSAAQQVLRRLGLFDRFKILRGENVGQAFQFLASGNADAGFIARSQIRDYEFSIGKSLTAETLAIDAQLHAPIEQEVVLLRKGEANSAAREFLQFVQSQEAQRVISWAGYQSPTWTPPHCPACKPPSRAGK